MSYETLKKTLLAAATAQAAALTKTYKQQAGLEEQRITDRARAIEEEIIQRASSEAEAAPRQLHQQYQLTAKANVLLAKQAELDATKEAVVQTIFGWDDATTEQLLRELLTLASKDATITAGAVHVAMLKKMGVKHIIADTIANEGGFIARTADEEANLTISHLVATLFTSHRAAIAARLFT